MDQNRKTENEGSGRPMRNSRKGRRLQRQDASASLDSGLGTLTFVKEDEAETNSSISHLHINGKSDNSAIKDVSDGWSDIYGTGDHGAHCGVSFDNFDQSTNVPLDQNLQKLSIKDIPEIKIDSGCAFVEERIEHYREHFSSGYGTGDSEDLEDPLNSSGHGEVFTRSSSYDSGFVLNTGLKAGDFELLSRSMTSIEKSLENRLMKGKSEDLSSSSSFLEFFEATNRRTSIQGERGGATDYGGGALLLEDSESGVSDNERYVDESPSLNERDLQISEPTNMSKPQKTSLPASDTSAGSHRFHRNNSHAPLNECQKVWSMWQQFRERISHKNDDRGENERQFVDEVLYHGKHCRDNLCHVHQLFQCIKMSEPPPLVSADFSPDSWYSYRDNSLEQAELCSNKTCQVPPCQENQANLLNIREQFRLGVVTSDPGCQHDVILLIEHSMMCRETPCPVLFCDMIKEKRLEADVGERIYTEVVSWLSVYWGLAEMERLVQDAKDAAAQCTSQFPDLESVLTSTVVPYVFLGDEGSFNVLLASCHDENTASPCKHITLKKMPFFNEVVETQNALHQKQLSSNFLPKLLGCMRVRDSVILVSHFQLGIPLSEILRHADVDCFYLFHKYFRQVLQGAQYLHQNRILYLNWQCAHILITCSSNRAMLSGGHISTVILPDNVRYMNINDRIIASVPPRIAAPEVLNGTGVSFPADVWGLGCLLYQLVFLHQPFEIYRHTRWTETRQKILAKQLPPNIPQTCQGELRQLLTACWRWDGNGRWSLDQVIDWCEGMPR